MLPLQGVYPPSTFSMLGIAPSWYGSVEWQYPPHLRQGAYEEEGRAINTLKVGPEREYSNVCFGKKKNEHFFYFFSGFLLLKEERKEGENTNLQAPRATAASWSPRTGSTT